MKKLFLYLYILFLPVIFIFVAIMINFVIIKSLKIVYQFNLML
jgi:hypothetical protein